MRSDRRSTSQRGLSLTASPLARLLLPPQRNELMAIRRPRALSELLNGAQVSEPPYRIFLPLGGARAPAPHRESDSQRPSPKPAKVRKLRFELK